MSLPGYWIELLTGEARDWLVAGLVATLSVTAAGLAVAAVVAIGLLAARIAPSRLFRLVAAGVIGGFRNTPLLVQLFFWYFAGYAALPQGLRDWLIESHPWAELPGGLSLLSPEFLTAAVGLGLFYGVFIAEELRAGLLAVPVGQEQAARGQGLTPVQTLVHVLLPQALANAWQPIVGQALNLMKFSSLASAIGLAELTYQVRQIESVSARGFEAMAAGTVLYLAIGLIMGRALGALAPAWRRPRRGS